MEKAYWLRRKSASLKAAQTAAGAQARITHYDLAGRNSVKAASAVPPLSIVDEAAPAALPEDAPENTHV